MEARDRVGGRVYTDEKGNEIGAAWIHGTTLEHPDGTVESNPVMDMATEFITEDELYATMNFYAVHSDGSDLGSDSSIWYNMWNVLNLIKTSKESRENAFKPTKISVFDFISKNWEKLFSEVRGQSEKAVIKSVIEWQSYYATNWENTSVGSMAVDKEFEGDQLLITNGGYTRILNRYLDHYSLRKYVKLNTPVSKIERNSEGCLVTANGEIYEADAVVVTVSLGVLKNNGINFTPPLPKYKQESIDRLGFGVYDKIFVTFAESIEADSDPNKFWPPGADVISIVPKSDDDYNEYVRSASIHMASSNPDIFENSVRRPYDARDHEHIGIEMANVSKVAGKPKIVMLIYERAAKQMEQIAHDKIMLAEFARKKLSNAFPDKYIPEIVEVDATTWGSDPYAYGSFANIPVGASGQDMINLSEPVDDKIFFAGEATFPLHYSTVHGALKSGRREFARLLKKYYPDAENIYECLLEKYIY